VTRYIDPPVVVRYRSDSGWRRALAFAVRRSNGYTVLISLCEPGEEQRAEWVPRSRIRAEDPNYRPSDTHEQ
jgi:hypothetical protein